MPPQRARKIVRQGTLDQFLSSPSSSGARKKSLPPSSSVSDSSGSDSDDVQVIKFEDKGMRKGKVPVRGILLSSSEEDELSDTSDDKIEASRKSQKRRFISPSSSIDTSKAHHSQNCIQSSSESGDEEESKGPKAPSFRKGKERLVDSDNSDVQPLPAKRRRIIKGRPEDRADRDPGSDKSEDLLSGLEDESILPSRLRAPKKSSYSQKLQNYKNRKKPNSQKPVEDVESEESVSSDDHNDVPFDDAVPPDGIEEGGYHIRNDSGSESESNSGKNAEDSFIVEDEGEAIILPPEFSMDSHQDLSHHFKIICQYFVHLATLKPKRRANFVGSSQKDSYFSVPLYALRRKLSGLKDSLVASSIWSTEFKQELQSHPILNQDTLAYSVPLCDACHIGGRVATMSMQISGLRYNTETYQTIDAASDDDESDEPETVSYCLGRFCARRASVYHSFSHWEFALFSTLETEVRDLRNPEDSERGEFVRVQWGDQSEVPDDVNDPDQIMDWLDRRGVIHYEYSKIKRLMEDARNLEYASKNGGDVD